MAGDWLASRRTEVAADRILDAADELFTRQDAATVGMNDIAAAAGCSRATLYRYFENREALHSAYVHRESQRLFGELTQQLAGESDPRARLIQGMLTSLHRVRESPSLASWFATTQRPIGGEMAEQSEVIEALVGAFVRSLGPDDDPTSVQRRARWLVRVLTSLLMFPGQNNAEERALLTEFVLPTVVPTTRSEATR